MGPSRGGEARGSGEAQSVSDFRIKKSISISMKLADQQKSRISINYLMINKLSKGGQGGKNQYKA
jgi:hypothetical protein